MPWRLDHTAAWRPIAAFARAIMGRAVCEGGQTIATQADPVSGPPAGRFPDRDISGLYSEGPAPETVSHFPSGQGAMERPHLSVAPPERTEKRRSVREKVIMPVRCRTKDGRTGRVILSEISAHGCRLYADDMMLRRGQWITIQPDKMEGMPGIVRWVDEKRAGVEFERPLYDAVATHLQHLYAVPADLTGTNVRVVSSSINPIAQRARR